MKVLTVIGARPQFIKAAIVSKALEKKGIQEIIVHTGQHFDPEMSANFFSELGMAEPEFNLGIHGLPHGAMTAKMLERLEPLMQEVQPDWCLVYGDTNSTLAGALAAKKAGIKVAHVEAGLRSFLEFQPEEINRLLTDRLSNLLFTPYPEASRLLGAEGLSKGVHEVGDVMYDLFLEKSNQLPNVKHQDFLYLTLHRAENVDDETRLRAWHEALSQLALNHTIICPLHPRTRKALDKLGLTLPFQVLKPLSYSENLAHLAHCKMVLTDSGGIQKEAFFSAKPCITLRDQSEWTELIKLGVNSLASPSTLLEQVRKMEAAPLTFPKIFGDGKAAEKIADILRNSN